ncbi:MAG: MOSC domain-containing protein [Chloroflexi bacterium]|nr:MOSC domain-containing protein [Chloroflexota bacterium]
MARVIAVCKSRKKGTRKEAIPEGVLREGYGLIDDAHADCATHRQISLLATDSITKMRRRGFDVGPGDFAENLTVEGMDLVSLPVGTRLSVGEEVILRISQIGKECHTRCAIYKQLGDCVMPKEGIFAEVVRGGPVRAGDRVRMVAGDGE